MGELRPSGPAVLVPHDPGWTVQAAEQLTQLRRALTGVVDVERSIFDHIGSTAVPGLDAKPCVDLQVRMPALPEPAPLAAALEPYGWVPEAGSRPDSPGVDRDLPWPGDDAPDWVWRKRLFVRTDPGRPGILHLRLTASPFGRRTVAFRDLLRSDPQASADYQRLKHQLAAEHAQDPDYDDYTRGKTTFIHQTMPD